jgi:hypothetical protein
MSELTVWTTRERRTCIVVNEDAAVVQYIRLNFEGLEVEEMSAKQFGQTYHQLADYPIMKAAKLYGEYCLSLGATEEVLDILAPYVKFSEKDREMSTKKKAAKAASKPAAKQAEEKVKAVASAKPAKAKKAAKTNGSAKKEAGKPRESAAQLFKDLIMQGDLTDKQIFARVKQKYELDDGKFGYVKWYRNALVKAGQKVPAAKE